MLYNLPCLIKAAQDPALRPHLDACLALAAAAHLDIEAFVARTQAHVPGVLGPNAVLRRLRRCQMRVLRARMAEFDAYHRRHRIDVGSFYSSGVPDPRQRPVDTQAALWFLIRETLYNVELALETTGRSKDKPRPAGLRHKHRHQ